MNADDPFSATCATGLVKNYLIENDSFIKLCNLRDRVGRFRGRTSARMSHLGPTRRIK